MTIAIGGFITADHPMAVIRQIIRNRVRGLTVVGAASAGLEIDMLIAAGCVKQVITPYVGAEGLATIGPMFRYCLENKSIKVFETDEGIHYQMLRAAALRLPFLPWRGGVGTSLPEINKDLKLFKDPIKKETLIAVPAVRPDVTIIHIARADKYGNAQHAGSSWGDITMHLASARTIVQAEDIVPNESIRSTPFQTSITNAVGVVWARYGAHPFASTGFYLADAEHLREYVDAANAYRKGNKRPLEDYLREYIYEPQTHIGYLERIGIKRLLSLSQYQ
jgi:glutaconate CoA-transferase subunit A